MPPDFSILYVLIFAAIGTIFGMFISIIMAVVGIFYNSLFVWLWLPIVVGFILGMVVGYTKASK